VLLKKGESLSGRLVLFDAMKMSFRELKLRKDPKCPICSDQPTIKSLIDYDQFCGISSGEPENENHAEDISPAELKNLMDKGEKFQLIDVRNPNEVEICRIDGAKLIPLLELANRYEEIDFDQPVILHCKSGARSMKAATLLAEKGKKGLKNLRGGILAWIKEIDPNMSAY
jgi:adenylyltransferase/sulfurtransferase